MAIQQQLGADIQMALDICSALPAPEEDTSAWRPAGRSPGRLRALGRPHSARRPVPLRYRCSPRVGVTPDLRAEHAEARTAALEFDGYGIGGLSRRRTETIRCCQPWRPPSPRNHQLDLACAISWVWATRSRFSTPWRSGVDMFDCVLPTSTGPPRHGLDQRWALPGASAARHRPPTTSPWTPSCPCRVCARFSRGHCAAPAGHERAHRGPTAQRPQPRLAARPGRTQQGPRIASGALAGMQRSTSLPSGNPGPCAKVSRSPPLGVALSPCTPSSTSSPSVRRARRPRHPSKSSSSNVANVVVYRGDLRDGRVLPLASGLVSRRCVSSSRAQPSNG